MKIVNPSRFPFAPFAGRMNFPRHSMTLIVKGTFDLREGGVVTEADEQAFPTGDIPYEDDDEGVGSARYESDFAHFKPRADLLLAGSCHPPGGEATRCNVRFQVGDVERELIVSGERQWRGVPGLRRMSAPEPFESQPIRYEAAYGGPDYERNPVGIGHRREDDEERGSGRFAPNIEAPDARVTSGLSRPRPAGFGPLGRGWKDRSAFLGTYRRSWLKNRWPWFPEDFDFSYYNAAPPEMQVPYLRGDESLELENLHPEHSVFRSRLPGLRVRCFVSQGEVVEAQAGTRFEEVEMNLDTLWVDADVSQVVLVWRGFVDVQSSEFEDVDHVYIRSEPLADAPASLEICEREFIALVTSGEALPEAEPIPPEEREAPDEQDADAKPEVPLPDPAAMRAEMRAAALAMLASAGAPVDVLSPEAESLIEKLAETDADVAAAREEAEQQEQLAKHYAALGLDMNDLPPVSAKAAAEQARMLTEMGVENVAEVMADASTVAVFTTLNAVLPKVGIDPEDLSGLIDRVKQLPGFPIDTPAPASDEPELERIRPLTREAVERESERRESFAREDLGGLDLSGLDLSRLDFSEANFAGTQLQGVDFTGALLVGASFEGADLTGAILPALDLRGSNFAGAVLEAAILAEAQLDGCHFEGARLDGADLASASLEGARFEGATCEQANFADAKMAGIVAGASNWLRASMNRAELSGADFSGADVVRVDFFGATLHHARFDGATLADSTLERVACASASFIQADCSRLRASGGSDFRGCNFQGILADESIWEQAQLDGADFTGSRLEAANFHKAAMVGAILDAADMPGARFMAADLSHSSLREANVFQGSFERATLVEADLSGANLYAVEFLDADTHGAEFDGANLKRSKLA